MTIKVDFIGKVGEDTGIGNYSTKLYYTLEDQQNIELGLKQLNWQFPILKRFPALNRKMQNFVEAPYKVLTSSADIQYFTSQRKISGLIFLPKKSLKNTVATIHDIGPYTNNYMGKPTQFLAEFYVRAIPKLKHIIAISESTKKELTEELGIPKEKITTIYQGVDQEYFQPQPRNEQKLNKYDIKGKYILYIGSEIPRKNIEAVMENFATLQQENPDLTLVKVGKAGSKKYRKQTLKAMQKNNLKKGKDVIFTGFVDEKHLPQIYSSAEATLLLSHYEGLGRPILESLASGTPVIANNIQPMNELLPKKMLTNPKNLQKTMKKYKKRQKKPETNRKIIKKYTWKRTAEKTYKLFKNHAM